LQNRSGRDGHARRAAGHCQIIAGDAQSLAGAERPLEGDRMRKVWTRGAALLGVFALLGSSARVAAENLAQAWDIALHVNQRLQAQQAQTVAAGLDLKAAKSDRMPRVRTYTFNAFLTAQPAFSTREFFGRSGATGAAGGSGAVAGGGGGSSGSVPLLNSGLLPALPATVSIFGPGQRDLPVSLTFATVPIYTGGRLLRSIDAADAQVGVQRSEEFRSALDLKLSVAEAYIGVLRAQKNLEVTRSNVEQLVSFARDVSNQREQGLAIRSDELAVQVSLANARLARIQTKTSLESAWAAYNRYLCRPMTEFNVLEELTVMTVEDDPRRLLEAATLDDESPHSAPEGALRDLIERAMRARPELVGLGEQARALRSQAEVARAGIRPQLGFSMGYIFIANNAQVPQGIGAASFYVDWTITDGGASRRRAAAIAQRQIAAIKERADTALDVELQVRTRWLELEQARRRVPVARLAIVQSAENVKVVTDRYRQQLSTYTEVLDAEARRIQSMNNFHNAVYDENLAVFRLRRAVGDL
jgi:outer membrane protein TolC